MLKNIESKVYSSAGGTGAGATVSAFVLWLLGVFVWGVPATAAAGTDAMAAVPIPVSGMLLLVLTVGGSFIGGYRADHTERPDLQDPAVVFPPEATELPDVADAAADAGQVAAEPTP